MGFVLLRSCAMKLVLFAVVLLGMVAFGLGACVAPPADLTVCPLEPGTRVPQEYANVDKDRQLLAYLTFLDSINQNPDNKCLEAYLEFHAVKPILVATEMLTVDSA